MGEQVTDDHRQLQAANSPDKCSEEASFNGWLALVNAACCGGGRPCSGGVPTACDTECANVSREETISLTQSETAGERIYGHRSVELMTRCGGYGFEQVLSPFKRYCKTKLQAMSIWSNVQTAFRTCPRVPKNTRSVPKLIH